MPDPGITASPVVQAAAAALPAAPAQPVAPPTHVAAIPVADPATWAATEPAGHRCPWCSTVLPESEGDRCPTCGANLVYGAAAALPGVTEVAPTNGSGRNAIPPRRNRLLSWISGEVDDEPTPVAGEDVPLEALSLPNRDVRREMLRLQLVAQGMVVSETGEIEPGPELQAEMAVVQAAAAAVEAPVVAEAHEGIEDVVAPDTEIRKAS